MNFATIENDLSTLSEFELDIALRDALDAFDRDDFPAGLELFRRLASHEFALTAVAHFKRFLMVSVSGAYDSNFSLTAAREGLVELIPLFSPAVARWELLRSGADCFNGMRLGDYFAELSQLGYASCIAAQLRQM